MISLSVLIPETIDLFVTPYLFLGTSYLFLLITKMAQGRAGEEFNDP